MMLPKEYGAYGELGFPLATALLVGAPNAVSLGLVAAGILIFLAHEPLLIARGLRGSRKQRELRGTATRQHISLGAAAVAVGGSALWAAGLTVRLFCLIPLGLGAVAFAVASAGREQTSYGQLIASAALVSVSLPVAVAGGRAASEAALLGLVWFVSFALFTAVVRGLTRRNKDQGRALRVAALGFGVTVAGLCVMSSIQSVPSWPLFALAPSVVATLVLLLWAPSPRYLHKIGWSLVGSSVATLFGVVLFMP